MDQPRYSVGVTLLLPVSTAVKPAYSAFAHHPNPNQEGESQSSQLNQNRRHTRSVKERRFEQCRGVLFSEIFGLITCGRVRFSQGAERHIRWILAG